MTTTAVAAAPIVLRRGVSKRPDPYD